MSFVMPHYGQISIKPIAYIQLKGLCYYKLEKVTQHFNKVFANYPAMQPKLQTLKQSTNPNQIKRHSYNKHNYIVWVANRIVWAVKTVRFEWDHNRPAFT